MLGADYSSYTGYVNSGTQLIVQYAPARAVYVDGSFKTTLDGSFKTTLDGSFKTTLADTTIDVSGTYR